MSGVIVVVNRMGLLLPDYATVEYISLPYPRIRVLSSQSLPWQMARGVYSITP